MMDRRRALMLAPLGLVALAGAGFYAMLDRMQQGDFDPHGIPSPLIGKPVPDFSLPALGAKPGFSSADLLRAGHPVLVNFFASWCEPCVVEADELAALRQQGVAIWGVNYKDKPGPAADFLAQHGDPYQRIAEDDPGRVAIDFGLYGVPETFFIDKSGIIRWRWAGPLTAEVAQQQLDPLLRKYA
jgi:cytochrome c biogenesis protein CcmG/thiol:disulfide interchange protein DsbE